MGTAELKVLRGRVLERQGISTLVSYHPLAVRRRPNLLPTSVSTCGRPRGNWRF
ncbi:MAG: hypothetical protein ACM3ZA_08855 [Bacillota bacterium]